MPPENEPAPAANDPAPEPDPTSAPEPDPTPELQGDPDALGDPGKRALDSMKDQWKSEKAARKAAEDRIAKITDETEKATASAREDGRREAMDGFRTMLVEANVRAEAAGRLNDPADALSFLDMTQFEVSDDGNVDGNAIRKAIDTLLDGKPYLAAQRGTWNGAADQGPRNGGDGPAQLTRDDLRRMSPDAIVKAKSEGRLNDVLGVKQ